MSAMDDNKQTEVPDYFWPSPDNTGWWVDAWNGAYPSLAEALRESKVGDWANNDPGPRVLAYGENTITQDEVDARYERMGYERNG
jgi:hypothetical protein